MKGLICYLANADGIESFELTISNIPSGGWYRLRAEAVLKSGQHSKPVYTTGFLIDFKPSWPVPSVNRYNSVTSGFVDSRLHPILGVTRPHYGIDIAAPLGAEIIASASGIARTGWDAGGFGNYIVIDHSNGLTTTYGHCSQLLVSNGQPVSQNEVIANAGSTGASTGSHLHFEVRKNDKPINPNQYLDFTIFPNQNEEVN